MRHPSMPDCPVDPQWVDDEEMAALWTTQWAEARLAAEGLVRGYALAAVVAEVETPVRWSLAALGLVIDQAADGVASASPSWRRLLANAVRSAEPHELSAHAELVACAVGLLAPQERWRSLVSRDGVDGLWERFVQPFCTPA